MRNGRSKGMMNDEEARGLIGNIDYLSCHLMADYITQEEEIKTKVNRYFEILSNYPFIPYGSKIDVELNDLKTAIKEWSKPNEKE
jgi:hypothetical protein